MNKGDYVRDMAGNISKVECIIDYKRTPSIPYLTSKGVIILTNDIYLDSDIKYGKCEKVKIYVPEADKYSLIEVGDYVDNLEVVGKSNTMITLSNGISRYLDFLNNVSILTKEKIDDNTIKL